MFNYLLIQGVKLATVKLLMRLYLVILFVYLFINILQILFYPTFLSDFSLMCFKYGDFQTLTRKNKLMNFHVI